MYKKTMTYQDFDGNERTEDFYFNLTPAECANMELRVKGGYTNYVQRVLNAKDTPEIIKIFQELIDLSYGVKCDDGRKFVKNAEILEDFKSTQAYSDLYMLLGTDDKAAAEFVNAVIPKEEQLPQDHKQSEKVTPINK